jgi:hypothetical protein
MWWNGPGAGWGPMYGWWIMPIFGIFFLLIVLLIVGRFFGGWGGYCGRTPAVPRDDDALKDLKKEIQELKEEIRELKKEKVKQ